MNLYIGCVPILSPFRMVFLDLLIVAFIVGYPGSVLIITSFETLFVLNIYSYFYRIFGEYHVEEMTFWDVC